MCNDLRVYKIDGLSFELVGGVEIGQNQNFGRVLRRQICAKRLFAHDFESLQGVLVCSGQQVVRHPLHIGRLARVDEAEHLAEHFVVNVGDFYAVVLPLFHLVLKHGSKDRAPSRQDRFVSLKNRKNNSNVRIA